MSYFKVFGLTHILWWPRHLGAKWADGTIGGSVCYMQSLMVSCAHIKTCICFILAKVPEAMSYGTKNIVRRIPKHFA